MQCASVNRMDDLISRQAVLKGISLSCMGQSDAIKAEAALVRYVKKIPSAEPEIIRCKDCKYRDENWRRVSVRWLPCMDVRTGSNWYCGSAERRTDE